MRSRDSDDIFLAMVTSLGAATLASVVKICVVINNINNFMFRCDSTAN